MARALSRAAASAMRRLTLSASSASYPSSIFAISASSAVSPGNIHNIVTMKYLFSSISQSRASAGGSRKKVCIDDEAEDGGKFLEKDAFNDDDVYGDYMDSEDAFSDDDFKKFPELEEEDN